MQCLRKSQCPPKNTPPSAPAWKPCPTMISPSLSPPAPQPRIPPLPQTQPTQMLPPLSRTPPHHRPLCRRLRIPPLHAGAAVSPSELHPSPHNEKNPGPTSPDLPIVSKSYIIPVIFHNKRHKIRQKHPFSLRNKLRSKTQFLPIQPANPQKSRFSIFLKFQAQKAKSGGFNGKNR